MQTYCNLTPLCSDTHFQLQHHRYLPRPADFEGVQEGTTVDRLHPKVMLPFYESIHGIFSDFTLTEVHNEWNDVLAKLVDLAVASTTTPTPVTKSKVTDLRNKNRWRSNVLGAVTVVQYLHRQKRCNGTVWGAMFEIKDAMKDPKVSPNDNTFTAAAAGASKDCDNPFDPASTSAPAKTAHALRPFKRNDPVGVLVGNLVSAAEAKAIRAKQGNGAIILLGGNLYDVTSDTLSQNHARHMRSPLIHSAQDSVKLITGSRSTDGSSTCYWTIRAKHKLKRGDILQVAVSAAQDGTTTVSSVHKASGAQARVPQVQRGGRNPDPPKTGGDRDSIEVPGPATTAPSRTLESSSTDEASRNTNANVCAATNPSVPTTQGPGPSGSLSQGGEVHRSTVSRGSPHSAMALFSAASLPDAPSVYEPKPFFPRATKRLRMKTNATQVEKDRYAVMKLTHATESHALKDQHGEQESARKLEHIKHAADILITAVAACPNVDWSPRYADASIRNPLCVCKRKRLRISRHSGHNIGHLAKRLRGLVSAGAISHIQSSFATHIIMPIN